MRTLDPLRVSSGQSPSKRRSSVARPRISRKRLPISCKGRRGHQGLHTCAAAPLLCLPADQHILAGRVRSREARQWTVSLVLPLLIAVRACRFGHGIGTATSKLGRGIPLLSIHQSVPQNVAGFRFDLPQRCRGRHAGHEGRGMITGSQDSPGV